MDPTMTTPEDEAVNEAPKDNEAPTQEEMPFAIVLGEALTELPKDLYIPPQALEVFLDAFEGPLDLLLYLIRKQNIDILDIPIARIADQYMGYIDLMLNAKLELAAEYLVMAAMLAEIKSRMLLPRPEGATDEEEEDPRAQLVRRLQEYERYSQAAQEINELPRIGRDVYLALAEFEGTKAERPQPQVSLTDMLGAFRKVLERADLFKHHHIQREPLSVRERMTRVLDHVNSEGFVNFENLFDLEEGRMGVVVTFLAILELLKESMVTVVQQEPFAPIHIKAAG
jgi:segregation and condensation protein A